MKIKIASRASKLALVQTNLIKEQLENLTPHLSCDIITVNTKGDKILETSLQAIGDKGLFTKELEHLILYGNCDIAIHSAKDLPSTLPEGLTIGPIPKRDDYRDVLISQHHIKLRDINPGNIIGTSSLRRISQLHRIRPDLKYETIRGNIDTRLKKLYNGHYQGIILAAAGINRLGLQEYITEYLDDMIPAVGQGALIIEYKQGSHKIEDLLHLLEDKNTTVAITAERAFLKTIEGGCKIPTGALATIKKEKLHIKGFVADLKGETMLMEELTGSTEHPQTLGNQLAQKLIDKGARAIIETIQ